MFNLYNSEHFVIREPVGDALNSLHKTIERERERERELRLRNLLGAVRERRRRFLVSLWVIFCQFYSGFLLKILCAIRVCQYFSEREIAYSELSFWFLIYFRNVSYGSVLNWLEMKWVLPISFLYFLVSV